MKLVPRCFVPYSTRILLACIGWQLASTATFCQAWQTKVAHLEVPTCDLLSIPVAVDELGSPITPFPFDELIDHHSLGQGPAVCPSTDTPLLDETVEILNLTGRTFSELWYVADPETTITNVDGFAEDWLVAASGVPVRQRAFRIDNVLSDPNGMHHPLIFESNPNGLFDPGETWRFVLQDYTNALGLPADLFTSLNVGLASINTPGVVPSTGSIIAIPVPEPAPLAMMTVCLLGLGMIRTSRGRSTATPKG